MMKKRRPTKRLHVDRRASDESNQEREKREQAALRKRFRERNQR